MEEGNFENLLRLWKADVFGSKPVRTEKFNEAVKIYEEYANSRKEENNEEKEEDLIRPDELMEILKSEGIEMKGGSVKFKEYSFSRALPVMVDHINNLSLEKKLSGRDVAKDKIRNLIGREKIFDKVASLIEEDPEIKRLRQEIVNISGKKKNMQARKIEASIGKRANWIFESFFEKLS